jgi:hypothetical protein
MGQDCPRCGKLLVVAMCIALFAYLVQNAEGQLDVALSRLGIKKVVESK